jgi:cyclopropane fatty-acyl-phospholipid synthase-like methyltransferase
MDQENILVDILYLLNNKTIFLNLFLWVISIFLVIKFKNYIFLLIPIIVFIVNEFILLNFGIDIYTDRTKLLYNWMTIWNIYYNKNDTNFTEGWYGDDANDINKSPVKANEDRFDEVIKRLKLQKGDRVLDLGCGNGDFIIYLKKQGYNPTGVTFSNNQAREIKMRDSTVNVFVHDYRKENKNLEKRFDAISALGTFEHVYSGHPNSLYYRKEIKKAFENMFNIHKKWIDPESKNKRIFSTTLHYNMNKDVITNSNVYHNERMGGIGYPPIDENLGVYLKNTGWILESQEDMTIHYYLASKLNNNHFGSPSKISPLRILLTCIALPIYPLAYSLYTSSIAGTWMWQFDGKNHKSLDDCSFEKDDSKRPVTLYWHVCRLE